MSPASRTTARHYRWGKASDGWHLPEGDDLSVIEKRIPPDAAKTRRRHRATRQFFYAIEGEATLEANGILHVLAPGEGLPIPPGVMHQLHNEGTTDARFLVISVPRSHGDRKDVSV